VFVDVDGTVRDRTGVLSEDQLRERITTLFGVSA